MRPLGNIEKLLLTIEINDKVIEESAILDASVKDASKTYSKITKDLLEKESKISSYGLSSLRTSLLTYWNESINPDTERFWKELKMHGIDYERKEPLRFALANGRFRNVHQGIDARKHWEDLKKLSEIQNNYSSNEIEQIDTIIREDEDKRSGILRKCLIKGKIPSSQYLKFGECIAYMAHCNLWDKHFSKNEVEELYDIWEKF
jgi:hypothetical protein